jgi:hypothetical protein
MQPPAMKVELFQLARLRLCLALRFDINVSASSKS